MTSSSRGLLPADFGYVPDKTGSVKHVQVVQPLIPIVAAVKVNFLPMDCCGVVIARSRSGPESFWLVTGAVYVSHIWLRLGHR